MSDEYNDGYPNSGGWTPDSDKEGAETGGPIDPMASFRHMPANERPQLSHIMAIAMDCANEITIDWDKIDSRPDLVQRARMATKQNAMIVPVMESLWTKLRDGTVNTVDTMGIVPEAELPRVFMKLSEELFVAYVDRLVSEKIELILSVTGKGMTS